MSENLVVPTMAEMLAQGKQPEVLFWVGCAGSFDDRAKKITKAFVYILNKANINFGVLGIEESSSGDAAKRAGNEFLFQMQALTNIEILNSYNVKKIVKVIVKRSLRHYIPKIITMALPQELIILTMLECKVNKTLF